jgi:hypothetical protein
MKNTTPTPSHPKQKRPFILRDYPADMLRKHPDLSKGARELYGTMRSMADARTGELRHRDHWYSGNEIDMRAEISARKRKPLMQELVLAGLVHWKRDRIQRVLRDRLSDHLRMRCVSGRTKYCLPHKDWVSNTASQKSPRNHWGSSKVQFPRPLESRNTPKKTGCQNEKSPHKQRPSSKVQFLHGARIAPASSSEVHLKGGRSEISDVGSVGGDKLAPRAVAVSLDHHHPPHEETTEPDDDERENHRHRSPQSLKQNLKATALSRFKKKHGDEFDPKLVEQWADQIEERALAKGTTIMSAEYFETGLENEAATMKTDVSKPPPSQDDPDPSPDDIERGISFWACKLVESGAVSLENAREKVLEFVDEKGLFTSWEKCRGFYDLVRTNVFPDTPEPRENGEKIYFPETVGEILELAAYPGQETTAPRVRTILCYLRRWDKFKSREQRWAFEDRIAYQHQQKKSDEERARDRDKVNRRNRERYAERKAGDQTRVN